MDPEEIYKQWRWAIYNQVEIDTIIDFIQYPKRINPYAEVDYYAKYTPEIIRKYKDQNFDVSVEQIRNYDEFIVSKNMNFVRKFLRPLNNHFLRSNYIENCFVYNHNLSSDELNEKYRTNLIYYYWWDLLTHEELIQSIINGHFLKSTSKLIEYQSLCEYIGNKFNPKDDLIKYVLSNFCPKAKETVGAIYFDFQWLFGNEIKKAIRIFENECRLDFNEKIIGAFFNEDLLYREIKRIFGDNYKVISQGSPLWLKPQRFDIYFPELNIAIEYQGEQHFRPVDFGGKGDEFAEKQFQQNLLRDNIKRERSYNNNCHVLFANPNYDIEVVINEIELEIAKRRI
jgi:hypothetical protein